MKEELTSCASASTEEVQWLGVLSGLESCHRKDFYKPLCQERMQGFCSVTFSILNEMQNGSYLSCRALVTEAHGKQISKQLKDRLSFFLHNYLYYNYLLRLNQYN